MAYTKTTGNLLKKYFDYYKYQSNYVLNLKKIVTGFI